MIRLPDPALQAMELADGTWRREENRCVNQLDKRHEIEGMRGNGAMRGAGRGRGAGVKREATQQPAGQEGQELKNKRQWCGEKRRQMGHGSVRKIAATTSRTRGQRRQWRLRARAGVAARAATTAATAEHASAFPPSPPDGNGRYSNGNEEA